MDIRHAIANELPKLRRYARALSLGDVHGADDLVQQTLERALERTHLFQPDTNLRAWLFTILHNVNANNWRKLATRPYEVWDEEAPQGALTTPSAADGKLALRDMDRALAQLTDEQRKTVLLVSLEGMGYKEVSEVLNVPIGTVMSRLARGRERLKTLMGNEGKKPVLRRVK